MIPDRNTEIKLAGVCPDVAARWREVAKAMWDKNKYQLKVTEGLRTFSQQWEDFGKGRLKDKNGSWVICDMRKVITFAKAGESFHQYGLAIDSCFVGPDPYLSSLHPIECDKLWREYGKLCQDSGMTWGGEWSHPDRPHCEMRYGLNIHEIQILYENNGIKGVWEKCKNVTLCGSEMIHE